MWEDKFSFDFTESEVQDQSWTRANFGKLDDLQGMGPVFSLRWSEVVLTLRGANEFLEMSLFEDIKQKKTGKM